MLMSAKSENITALITVTVRTPMEGSNVYVQKTMSSAEQAVSQMTSLAGLLPSTYYRI